MLRRRDVLGMLATLTAGAAQGQAQPLPRIGVLVHGNNDPTNFVRVMRETLRELGRVDGQNIRIELHSAEGRLERLPDVAADLVRVNVDLIVAWQTPAAEAAKQATRDIPIVFAVGEAVDTGLVASLARPGGNATGVSGATTELGGKCLELMREFVPLARRMAALCNAKDGTFAQAFVEQVRLAGRPFAVDVEAAMIASSDDLERTISGFRKRQIAAAVVQPSLPTRAVVELAAHHRLPSASPWRRYAEAGGLFSYSARSEFAPRTVAVYVSRVLAGAKPGDLPVMQPTEFSLVINLRSARALGVEVPPFMLARADELLD